MLHSSEGVAATSKSAFGTPVAQHRDDVHTGVGIFEIFGVVVNYDNVVPFGGQPVGKGIAHLAVADNDDFHKNHLKHMMNVAVKATGFVHTLEEPSTISAAL